VRASIRPCEVEEGVHIVVFTPLGNGA
jgi:hypothetical protein